MAELGVAIIGAGRWAERAHLPGWLRDPRARVVGVYDLDQGRAGALSAHAPGSRVYPSEAELLADPEVQVVDVVTWGPAHFQSAIASLESRRHVLCEKPVHREWARTREAGELALSRGLRTKVGFTFRFSPAMMRMRELISEGYVGRPLVFNGFEQNSQFLDPLTPIRAGEGDPAAGAEIQVGSLEGYGAPIIDLALWFLGSELEEVVGQLANLIPERLVPGSQVPVRLPIDDADAFLCRFANGAIGTIQSSYVTVGNYPGLEARLYGTEGALICRLVEEEGICERLYGARRDQVEFRPLQVPERLYPPGGGLTEPWDTAFYANLISTFVSEINDLRLPAQADFLAAARVQEVINAVELSHRRHGWVRLPLEG